MAPGILGKVKKTGDGIQASPGHPGDFFQPPPQKKCIVNHFYAFNPCVSPLFDCVEIVLIFVIIQIGLIFCIRLYRTVNKTLFLGFLVN